MRRVFSAFLLVAALAASHEQQLNADNFDEVVSRRSSLTAEPPSWIIEFYSDKCTSCREFEPTWKEFAASVAERNGSAEIGRVNIDTKSGLKLAQKMKNVLTRIPKVVYMTSPTTSYEYHVLEGDTLDRLLDSLSRFIDLRPTEL